MIRIENWDTEKETETERKRRGTSSFHELHPDTPLLLLLLLLLSSSSATVWSNRSFVS